MKLNLKNFGQSRCERDGHIFRVMPEWLAKDFPEDDNMYCCLCGIKGPKSADNLNDLR